MKQHFTQNRIPLLLLLIAFITAGRAQEVTSGGDDGSDGTLRSVIENAEAGSTITFSVNTVNLNSEIEINKDLSLEGDATIDGNKKCRIFNITSGNVSLSELYLTNGKATNGGAIYVKNSHLDLYEVTISNSVADAENGSGGAIFVAEGASLNAENSTFKKNLANRAGGAIEGDYGDADGISLTNSNFFENNTGVAPATAAPGNGGAVHITGPGNISIYGGEFEDNIAAAEGGALWIGSGVMTINGSHFYHNISEGNTVSDPLEIKGGGALFANDNGTLIINEGTTIEKNFAAGDGGSGGGILIAEGARLEINGTENAPVSITNNAANRAGGGIEDWSLEANKSVLNYVQFSGNSAGVSIEGFEANAAPGNGGAIHITGTGSMTINGGYAYSNLAAAEGGGFWNSLGTMDVVGTGFDNNTASGDDATNGGGGLFNNGGTLNVSNTYIRNNTADGQAGSGGGIQNVDGGTLMVMNTEISGNSANRAGGGIEDNSSNASGTLTIENVSLNENTTGDAPGNGGGLHITGPGNATITGGEVTYNTAANEGGGLWNGTGTMTVTGTNIRGNTANGNTESDPLLIRGGGGIFALDNGTLIINEGTNIEGNFAPGDGGSGGGILVVAGVRLEINGTEDAPVTITNNAANRAGGGLEDWSLDAHESVLNYVEFSGNSAGVSIEGFEANAAPGNGGAIHITGSGSMTINEGFAYSNRAASEGGGFWNSVATMNVVGTGFDNNTASGDDAANGGGGLFNNGGTLNVSDTYIRNNTADGESGSGGGIQSVDGGTLMVMNTEISGNSANRAGGGIEDNSSNASGTITLEEVVLNENTTGDAPGNGGGLHITGPGNATITGGEVTYNYAANEGGGLWNGTGTMTVTGTTISGNTANGDTESDPLVIRGGGGIFALNNGTLIINEGTTIDGNFATGSGGSGGGILTVNGVRLEINGTEEYPVTISNNAANRAGGGIEDWSLDTEDAMLQYVNFYGNSAGVNIDGFKANAAPGNGGAIHITGNGSMEIENTYVNDNHAAAEGGGFWNGAGTMIVNNGNFNSNIAYGDDATNGGGALFNNGGSLNVWYSEITNNEASGEAGSGGGIQNVDGGALNVNSTTISGNSANRAGGGIEDNSTNAEGTVQLTNITLDGNRTGSAPGNGGGFHITGPGNAWVNTSTVSNNYAANQGGGLWNGAGSMNVITSTISGNTTDGTGGGIYNLSGSVFVNAATVVYNVANGIGGGIDTPEGSTTTIKNSIIALNEASSGMDLGNSGTYVSTDYNLIGQDDMNVFPAQANDIVGTMDSPINPMIEELADNGGPTQTHALDQGSPAFNAANPNDMEDDQRGEPVFEGRRDIGAFEAQASLSIEDLVQASLTRSNLYPNPATGGVVSLNIPDQITNTINIDVVSIGSGKVVHSQEGQAGANELQLGDLAAGTYVVRLITGNNVESLKLILGR